MIRLTTREVVGAYACLKQAERSLSSLTSDTTWEGIQEYYEGERIAILCELADELRLLLDPNRKSSPFSLKAIAERKIQTGIHQLLMRGSSRFLFAFTQRHYFKAEEVRYIVHCFDLMNRLLTTGTRINFRMVQRLRRGCLDSQSIIHIRCGYVKGLEKAGRIEFYPLGPNYWDFSNHYSFDEIMASIQ